MPFARHVGTVAVLRQQLGEEDIVSWLYRFQFVAPDLMTIESCYDASPRRSAAGAIIELRKHQPVVGQSIEIWRIDLASLEADIGIPQIVGKDNQNVWAIIRRNERGGREDREAEMGQEKISCGSHMWSGGQRKSD